MPWAETQFGQKMEMVNCDLVGEDSSHGYEKIADPPLIHYVNDARAAEIFGGWPSETVHDLGVYIGDL